MAVRSTNNNAIRSCYPVNANGRQSRGSPRRWQRRERDMKVVDGAMRSGATRSCPRSIPPNRQDPELIGGSLPLAITREVSP